MNTASDGRAALLDELSDLLGARILGVTFAPPMYRDNVRDVSSRKPVWGVGYVRHRQCHCGQEHEPQRVWRQLGPSGAIRNPKKLTALAQSLGRPFDLAPFTAEDGHRIIRLLHQLNNLGE